MSVIPTVDSFAGAGAVIGVVVDVDDPEGEGRVKVTFPFLGSEARSEWAPIAAAMAGNDRGMWMEPEVDDEAVVVFERNDPSRPIVLGFLWSALAPPPSTVTRERVIRSVNGHTIRFLDSTPTEGGNAGGIIISDAHQNEIVMTNGKVTIRSIGILELDAAVIMVTSCGVTRIVSPTGNPI
jgi:uncharacterized protein involved in type VI secretion and phage assembly